MKTLARSFAGGEITPELFGRLDLPTFQTGLAKALNFEILPHGPARNRAGFEYVLETKFSAKHSVLIPFSFNTQQTFQLEFGDLYVRFHTNDGTLLETGLNITAITSANPGVFTIVGHGFTNGQWVFLSGIGGPTLLNGRFGIVQNVTANTFTLTDLATVAIRTDTLPAYTAGGTAARVYEVATPYLEADLFDIHYVQSSDVLTLVHPTYQQRELKRLGATNWTDLTFTLVPVQAAPTAIVATPSGAGAEVNKYEVTGVATDGQEESLASASATAVGVALATAGAFNTVTWTNAANAIRYNVYKIRSGLYGYVGQAVDGTIGFKDDNIFPDMSKTPPEGADPFTSVNNYPGAVSYYEQRRIFAGTNLKPQNIWMTRSATESNLTYSIPTRDDDSIAFRIAARQSNRIRHIVPMSDLILLTDGGVWRVTAVNSDAITPTSVSVKQQSTIGANNVQPVVANKTILYAQARGGHLRELAIDRTLYSATSIYASTDASIMAPHLFDNFTLTSMAYVTAPYTQWWGTRSDGQLLCLTYVPEHQVIAWSQHNTLGTFESVAATGEGNEDFLYAIIKRTINARTVRYVERKHSRLITVLSDSFFVDSGLQYVGAPASVISGFWHLEGQTLSLLVDGAVHPARTVTNGAITLDYPCVSTVTGGIPYNADLQTLPLSMQQLEAFGQGKRKNVNKAYLRLAQSSGVFAGPAFTKLNELKQRTSEPYGTPPALINDELPLDITPSWSADGHICVRQSQPLPVTLVSLTLDVAIGD